jgi:hypothetical protein
MAEVTDIGTAISLGTNLQPDRTQPLTRASNQWLANQMRQDALKAKQQEKMDAKKQTIYSGLKGWGSEFEDLNERSKVLATDVIVNKADAYEKNDIARMAQIDSDYQRNQQELNALAAERRTQLKSVDGTPAEGIKSAIYTNTVPDFINKNLDYANYFEGTDRGAVLVNPPKKVDTGKVITSIIQRNGSVMPLEVQGSFQHLFGGAYTGKGMLGVEDIKNISNDLVRNAPFLESYYMENRQALKPLFDKKFAEIAAQNPNADIGQIVLKAKQEVTKDAVLTDLNNKNNFEINARRQQDFNINLGGDGNRVSFLNSQNRLGSELSELFNSSDITQKLSESGQLPEMFKNSSLGNTKWERGISVPLAASSGTANVRTLKGTTEVLDVTPYDIFFATDDKGKKHALLLIGAKTSVTGGLSRQMVVPLEGNMAMLSTLMKDPNYKNANKLREALVKIVGNEYDVPKIDNVASLDKRTKQVGGGTTPTPKSGAKLTAAQFRNLSISDRGKYTKNADGTYSKK